MVRLVASALLLGTLIIVTGSAPTEKQRSMLGVNGSTEGNEVSNTQTTVVYFAAAIAKHCSLLPKNKTIASHVETVLKDGMAMIEFKLKFRGDDWLPPTVRNKEQNEMLKPYFWVRSTGRFSTRLLLLKPNYDIMSFTTLEMRVRKVKEIELLEKPSNCLDNLTYNDVELLVRELIMNNFRNTTSGANANLGPTDEVCNVHIRDLNGADFTYYCCKRDDNMQFKCEYLQSDVWLDIMRTVIRTLKAAIILFCPLFIPVILYQEQSEENTFLYTLKKNTKQIISVTFKSLHKSTRRMSTETELHVRLSKLKHMTKFKETVQNIEPGKKTFYKIDQAEIDVEHRLLGAGEAPVSIFPLLYEFIINCRIRELLSVKRCCDAYICRKIKWYYCARGFIQLIVRTCLITPWFIRVVVYYKYELEEMAIRKDAAAERGYSFYFPGNFILYFTPLHYMFILAYIFLILDGHILPLLNTKYREKFEFVFRKCFIGMQSDSGINVIGGIVQLLLIPCTFLGWWVIFGGIFMWIILIPIALGLFAVYMFPTVNLTVRLLTHLFIYIFDKDPMSFVKNKRALRTFHGRIVQVAVIIYCLITMYSGILITFELTAFFMDVFVYTFIGLILHANYTMIYMPIGVLLILYGKDCFGSVSKRYRVFSSALTSYILNLCEDQSMELFFRNKENNAIVVDPCSIKSDTCEKGKWPDHTYKLIKSDFNHNLCLTVTQLAFFLTKDDEPKIPSKLFFEACNMKYKNSPGRLLNQYLKATLHFMIIVCFLLFVLLVVLTFGESHKLSATNQLLGTVAGGILPFLLRHFILLSHKTEEIDPDKDINFRVAVHDLIQRYTQDWLVHDIIAEEISVCSAERPHLQTQQGYGDEEPERPTSGAALDNQCASGTCITRHDNIKEIVVLYDEDDHEFSAHKNEDPMKPTLLSF